MKLILSLFVAVLLVACDSSEKKSATIDSALEKSTSQKTSVEEKKKKNDQDIQLKQNGDYSSLFVKKECAELITIEELSSLKGLPATQEDYGCYYKFDTNQDSATRIGFSHQNFPKASVQKEIKNYIKDAPFIYQEISDTGDTYLGFQPGPGRLLILNPNYDNTIMISYSKRLDGKRLPKEQIEENRLFAAKLANYLIKKHQK